MSMQEYEKKCIEEKDLRKIMKIFFSNFIDIYKIFYQIDPVEADDFKQKNEYFYFEKHKKKEKKEKEQEHNCSKKHSKIYIPPDNRSFMQQQMSDILDPSILITHLPLLLQDLGNKYNNIKQKGQTKDKLQWNSQTQQYVVHEVLSTGIHNMLKQRLIGALQKEQKVVSQQPLLLATVQTWQQLHPQHPLTFLTQDNLLSLDTNHYLIQSNYVGQYDFPLQLLDELDYLEKQGRFEQVGQQTFKQIDQQTFKQIGQQTFKQIDQQNIRNDSVLGLSLREVLQGDFNAIKVISNRMSAIPYELNHRMNYSCQISETFIVSYFSGRYKKNTASQQQQQQQQDYHRKHFDSSFSKQQDTGKQFSCLYFGEQKEIMEKKDIQRTQVKLYMLNKNEVDDLQLVQTIDVQRDMLLVLKSRKIAYSITSQGIKHFVYTFYVNGPPDYKTHKF